MSEHALAPAIAASLRVSATRELRFHRARRGIVVREWRLRDGTWCSCGAGIQCAVGGWEIPASVGSGGVLMVGHGGEKMLPADKSAKLDRLLDGGFGADGPELHVHVHALDGQDAYRFFTRPETQRALRELIRNGRWP